jgi:hypothetical protein
VARIARGDKWLETETGQNDVAFGMGLSLSLSVWLDQHVVGDVLEGDADSEEGAESGVGFATAIEPESKLVQVSR